MPKSKKSAILFFAIECRKKRHLKGTIPEIIGLVMPEWKQMSAADKQPYEDKAAHVNDSEKNSTVATIVTMNSEEIRIKRRTDIAQKLEKILKSNPTDDYMVSRTWRFIKFITFCRCDSPEFGYDPYYVLAEVGLVKYSLLDGIADEYHAFIKPNQMPVGYLSRCLESSRDQHKIPFKPNEISHLLKKSYAQIYEDIRKFIYDSEDTWEPVFALSDDIEQARFGLAYLHNKWLEEPQSRSPTSTSFPLEPSASVYDLECLMTTLSKNLIGFTQANQILTKYSFDYSPNTRCQFHQTEGSVYCALGTVKRQAYLISDHLCPMYGIPVTTRHLPVEKPEGEILHDQLTELRRKFRSTIISGGFTYGRGGNQSFFDIRYHTDDEQDKSSVLSDESTGEKFVKFKLPSSRLAPIWNDESSSVLSSTASKIQTNKNNSTLSESDYSVFDLKAQKETTPNCDNSGFLASTMPRHNFQDYQKVLPSKSRGRGRSFNEN